MNYNPYNLALQWAFSVGNLFFTEWSKEYEQERRLQPVAGVSQLLSVIVTGLMVLFPNSLLRKCSALGAQLIQPTPHLVAMPINGKKLLFHFQRIFLKLMIAPSNWFKRQIQPLTMLSF